MKLKGENKTSFSRVTLYQIIVITLIVIFSGTTLLFTISDRFYKKPDLEVETYQKNDSLYLRIYNSGNKRALIDSIYVCWFENPNSSNCKTEGMRIESERTNLTPSIYNTFNGVEYNPPLEILFGDSEEIKTWLDIPTLENNFISPSDGRWGIKICEKSIGCKVHIFSGVPQKTKIWGTVIIKA